MTPTVPSSRFARWMPEGVFLAFTTAAGLWAGGRWVDPIGDPGFSWSLAYRLAAGERLYRDVYLAYGPLSPYLLALWARLFGISSLSILLLNWVPAIAAGLLLLSCVRNILSPLERVALAGMILATSVFVPGAGRLVFPYYAGVVHAFVFALAAFLLIEPERRFRGASFLAGALAGLAFACKQELGVAALAGLLASSLAGKEKRFRRAAETTAGFAVVFLAAAAFVFAAAPFGWLHDRDHVWPLNPRTPAAYDALFRSVAGFSDPRWFELFRASVWKLAGTAALLAGVGGLAARERSPRAWRRLLWLAAALGAWWAIERFPVGAAASPIRLSVAASFLVAVLALASPGLEGRPTLVALGVFAGLAGLRAAVSPFVTGPYDGPAHFAAAASWAVLLLLLVPRMLWPASSARPIALTRWVLAGVVGVLFWWDAAQGAAALRFPWKEEVSTPAGRIFVDPGHAALLRKLAANVAAGDRILAVPENNAMDALFAARSVSPVLHLLPGWLDERIEAELIRRLDESPPKLVVVFTRATPELGMPAFGEGFGVALWEWCLRHYRVVYSSPRGKILRLQESAAVSSGATR